MLRLKDNKQASRSKQDALVIEKIRSGKVECFAEIVDRYQQMLYQVAYKILLNREDALDAVQDAFVLAYRALDQFDIERPFYLWLYKIAYNAAIKTYNRRNGQDMVYLDSLENPENLLTDCDMPEKGLLEEEIEDKVEQAVASLSPEYRAVFVLRVQEDMSYKEIADVLSIPEGTVMSRLARARERLQYSLRELVK